MRAVLPILLALAPIAGCDGGAAPPSGPTAEVHVGFAPRGLVDTITVAAVERLPLRAAELLSPDGTTTPASHIDVTDQPRQTIGQYAAGDALSAVLAPGGTGAPMLMPDPVASAATLSQQQLLAIVSTADLPLPDPVAYRRDWTQYRIRLGFGTPPGETETREIPAPEPPPRS